MKKRISNFEDFGKIPPQAVDLERLILGSILTQSDKILEVNSFLTSEMFYNEANGLIYNACLQLLKINAPIDILTCANKMRENGNIEQIGGVYYLTELSNLSNFSNLEYSAKILVQKFIQRKIIYISSNAIKNSFEDTIDVFEVVDELSDELRNINNILIEESKISWQEATENYIIELNDRVNNGITESGLKSGLSEIDRTIQGFRDGLYIIAGRPSMGKSALAFELACRFAELKEGKIAIFSLEMSRQNLINRVVSRYSKINQTRLLNANIDKGEMMKLMKDCERVSKLDFLINDKSTISIQQIISKSKVWAHKNKISAIFVDYIQLVRGTKQQRHLEIGEISKGLKALSKDLNIPIFGLAQLGREKDAGKSLPQMSELRESGDLEQDADCVMLIYRQEYYAIMQDNDGQSTVGLTKVIVAKNRNGAVNIKGCNLRSDLAINKYEDWDTQLNEFQEPKRIESKGKEEEDFLTEIKSPF